MRRLCQSYEPLDPDLATALEDDGGVWAGCHHTLLFEVARRFDADHLVEVERSLVPFRLEPGWWRVLVPKRVAAVAGTVWRDLHPETVSDGLDVLERLDQIEARFEESREVLAAELALIRETHEEGDGPVPIERLEGFEDVVAMHVLDRAVGWTGSTPDRFDLQALLAATLLLDGWLTLARTTGRALLLRFDQ